MPSVYSKLLHHSCYEIGHTWNPSCSTCALEIFISAFFYSCQMYGLVYAVTAAVQYKKLDRQHLLKLLQNYLRSALFLTINGFGYIGMFCLLRRLLGHINYPTVSFMPGFLSALLAIQIERPSRRPLLAVYVANVASECAFNTAVGSGWVRPVVHGSTLLFCAAMTVLGYCYHSLHYQPPPLMASIIRYAVGSSECGAAVPVPSAPAALPHTAWPSSGVLQWVLRLLRSRHDCCPHPDGCLQYAAKACVVGGAKGLAASCMLSVLPAVLSIVRNLSLLPRLLRNTTHLRLAAFMAWFSGTYRLTSCCCRRVRGRDSAVHGAAAGAVAAAGMVLYPAPSFALYTAWKTLETLCELAVAGGVLPAIPGATELLYSVMTGYLFHVSAVNQHHMKPSYWTMLLRLTDHRMAHFNRHLLFPYKQDSARSFSDFWPEYQPESLSPSFLKQFPDGLASIPKQ